MKRGRPLARKKPMKRSPMRRSGKKSKYKRRPRDVEYMKWVRRQPCVVPSLIYARSVVSLCNGRVQADHAGRRGIGQKADDRTCIPLCEKHHAARGDFAGLFKGWTQIGMRNFLASAITHTQQQYENYLAIRSYG